MTNIGEIFSTQSRLGEIIQNFISDSADYHKESTCDVSECEIKLQVLEKHWRDFQRKDTKLASIAQEHKKHSYFTTNVYEQAMNGYISAKAHLQKQIQDLQPPNPAIATSESLAGKSTDFPITPFNGDRRVWKDFKKKFKSLVLDNPKIVEIEKFRILNSRLVGDAKIQLRSFEFKAGNFNTIWETLCKAYDNGGLQLFTEQVLILSKMTAETKEVSQHLKYLLQTVDKIINVFQEFKLPVDQWDALLIYFVQSKLALSTLTDWYKELEEDSMQDFPTYRTFQKFLQNRISYLKTSKELQKREPTDADKPSTSANSECRPAKRMCTPDRVESNRSFNHRAWPGSTESVGRLSTRSMPSSHKHFHRAQDYTNQQGTRRPYNLCYFCHREHHISQCERFDQCSVSDRRKFVDTKGFCPNCLTHHREKDCLSPNRCRICYRKHHTKLHSDEENMNTSSDPTRFEAVREAARIPDKKVEESGATKA